MSEQPDPIAAGGEWGPSAVPGPTVLHWIEPGSPLIAVAVHETYRAPCDLPVWRIRKYQHPHWAGWEHCPDCQAAHDERR